VRRGYAECCFETVRRGGARHELTENVELPRNGAGIEVALKPDLLLPHSTNEDVRATFDGQTYLYQPFIFTDNEIPLVAGREIWGFAKKLAVMGRTSGGAGPSPMRIGARPALSAPTTSIS